MQKDECKYMTRSDVKIFQLLTDEVRCVLLLQLLREEQTQQQLATALDLNSSTVSRRIRDLEDSGLVERMGPRKAPYRVIFPAKTRELLQSAADLAQLSLGRQAEGAKVYADDMRKEALSGGHLRDRTTEGSQ